MASDAVGLERISRVVGYKITKGTFAVTSENLPQRIAILGEANHANQGTLDTDPYEFTSAQKIGQKYGYGSPLYEIARILRPKGSDGVGGIPTIIYPQAEPGGATSKKITITPSGTATGNGTHTIRIAGRNGIDGVFYNINIVTGDTVSSINQKIVDAINAVLGSPVTASTDTYITTVETKWRGLTANELQIAVDRGDNTLGIQYAVNSTQVGAGTPSIADALAAFGSDWNTIVVNGYGTQASIMTALEDFNGIADPEIPTGRYAGIIMKPFIALTGTVADDPTSITDAKLAQMTIALCPAPLSEGFTFEAAANGAYLFAVISQNAPHLDIAGSYYPDMPVPVDGDIGSMADYNNRDAFVKKGCSTVDLNAGRYRVQDFVTTYHPDGEIPPQFRYCRNIMLDLNVRYGYYLLEQLYVVDHVIINDDDVVEASNVIQPKRWKAILSEYFDNLVRRALLVDSDFSRTSLIVEINSSNPDRLETFFRYKRSGIARISSTTAEAGFNQGS